MPLSETDLIWNRAALESGGNTARAGDRALADLLLAHGMVMNGGIGHAVEALSSEEFSAALRGFRFFGFEEVALLLEDALNAPEEDLELADSSYGRLIPNDQVLVDGFEARHRVSPEAFAPVESSTN